MDYAARSFRIIPDTKTHSEQVSGAANPAASPVQNVRVNHGRVQILVTQQFLDHIVPWGAGSAAHSTICHILVQAVRRSSGRQSAIVSRPGERIAGYFHT